MTYISSKHKNLSDRIFDIVNVMGLLIFTICMVYPFYNSFILSFNEGKDAIKGGIYFWPRAFTLANYEFVLSNPDFGTAAFNTVARTVVGTLTALFFTAAFGYVISKKRLCFRKFYLVFGLITIYFSGGLIPTFILIRNLGLVNKFWVYIAPGLFSMFNSLIFMSFFRAQPAALEESAHLDGANDLVIFIKIIIPISSPVLASIALFTAVGHWNAWFDTMLYTNEPRLNTLAHMFMKMVTTQEYLEGGGANTSASVASAELAKLASYTSTSINLAAMVVTTAPIIMIYPFLQKYFVKGIMLGSIKG